MFQRVCSVLLRKTRTVFEVVYWTVSLTCILSVAFVASPDGYVRWKAWRESHVVVAVSSDSRIRDLAKNLKSWDFQQIDCMAKNAYFEARGEGDGGIDRVNDVVLNRAADMARYPDGPCQVITERGQFSWYSDGKDHGIKDMVSYNHIYTRSYNKYLYRKAGIVPDLTNGATHYHAESVSPKWKWAFLGRFGHHLFYR
jgi:spore germination cell wall hydrolase CwlJ-like protein